MPKVCKAVIAANGGFFDERTRLTQLLFKLKIPDGRATDPLIILEMFLQLDWSPPVVNSIDWTSFGKAHTCLHKVYAFHEV